ncbi:hypothetical protein ACWCSD_25835 [Nonomuraea sp. NPDC001684]
MRETPEELKELKELQTLLEASLSRSTSHLRPIVTANTLTVEQITRIGTARSAAKARHPAARPAAGAAHMRGEDLGVSTHGKVEIRNPEDGKPAADRPYLLAYSGIDKLAGVSRS